jgi:ferredoxin-type protein NapH
MQTAESRPKPNEKFQPRLMTIPVILMALLWIAAAAVYGQQDTLLALMIAYIGVFIGGGIGLYIALPNNKRGRARVLMMVMLGSLLLALALFSDHGNMQLEGLFFGVMAGLGNYIVLHYALAKIVGPLVFGRIWCGWACWFGMVFDLLPYPHSRYRIPGKWGLLRYAHFAASLGLVLALAIGMDYREGAFGLSGLVWFVVGLLLYYVVGIALALILKDNRAFCKYLCPLAVLLKTGSRFSVVKIAGIAEKCDSCNVCVEMCPMNIRIPDYILKGERVLSTECTLCQTCINLCPQDALKLSLKFDVGGKEFIDYVPPKHRKIH